MGMIAYASFEQKLHPFVLKGKATKDALDEIAEQAVRIGEKKLSVSSSVRNYNFTFKKSFRPTSPCQRT